MHVDAYDDGDLSTSRAEYIIQTSSHDACVFLSM